MTHPFLIAGAFLAGVMLSTTADATEAKQTQIAQEQGELSPREALRLKLEAELLELQRQVEAAQSQDTAAERDTLFKLLKNAESEAGGKFVANAIWHNWIESAPTEEVAQLVKDSMERRRWHDYQGAREILDKAIAIAPEYSEVWNQRAYIGFLQERFDQSLEDIEKAIELEPRHFAALAGKARILIHQGRPEEAREVLNVAVDIYPLMYERVLLGQLENSGQEPVEIKKNSEEL